MESWYCMTVVNSTISPVFVMSWPPVCPQLPVLTSEVSREVRLLE
jgi:hypothetical protein